MRVVNYLKINNFPDQILLKNCTNNGLAFKRSPSLYLKLSRNSTTISDHQRTWIDLVQEKVRWTNQQYENMVGIGDIRQMQIEVLQAEAEFLETTAKRKQCQDQIDSLKNRIKELWDKLESTSRSSDNYINLRTEEHKVVREQMLLDIQLAQLKDKEQTSFDTLSRLLRRSHELERLRQERSKTLQIISIGLTLVGSIVALMAQKAKNQANQVKLLEIANQGYQDLKENIDEVHTTLDDVIRMVSKIEKKVDKLDTVVKPVEESKKPLGWSHYIPGLSTLNAFLGYFF